MRLIGVQVLDALADQIAVVDGDGVIIAVNRAWQEFAAANGAPADVVTSVGLNYLSVCSDVTGGAAGDDSAAAAAAGIRAVLSGVLDRFELEYPCDSPTERRWFQMSVTPLDGYEAGPAVVVCHHSITQRRLLEDQLRWSSEERAAVTLHSIGDGVIVTDAAGLITAMNPTAERLTGWHAADAAGRSLPDVFRIVNAQSRLAVTDPAGLVIERGEVVGLANHTVLLARDGREFQISDSAAPIRDPGGVIAGVVLVFSDVTEEYRTAEQLATTAALLERTGEIARIGGWERDLGTGERVWSPEIYRILEIDPLVVATKDRAIDDYLTSEARVELHAAIDHGIATSTGWDLELPVLTAKGRSIWVRLQGETVVVDGVLVSVRGALQDITLRRAADESLRASQERLRAIIETEPECVKVVGSDGNLLEMNPAGLRMLEADSVDEVRSRSLGEFIVPEDRAAFAGLHRRVMAGEDGVLEFEVIGLRGSRRRLETHATPMRDATGQVTALLGITRDITERRQLEAKLLQAAKTESVGRLAGGVAHDFNNMLAVILGRTELALSQLGPDDPLRVDLLEAHAAAERSADLTRQLLAFAGQQPIEARAVDPNDTVARIAPLLRRLIGEDIDLTWSVDPNMWTIRIDPSQFDQILTNLVVNARDAISATGTAAGKITVTVTVSTTTLDTPNAPRGEHVRVAVTDNGPGLDVHTRANIFDPYFTTKGAGHGLGLSTVHGIVEQNQGIITVTSTPGDGATFEVFFPRHHGPIEPAHTPQPHDPKRRATETLLVVEDQPAILDLITTILKTDGYTVLAAPTATDAIRIAREHPDPIDLLLTDVVMPDMNGPDLATNLTAAGIHTRHLYMSGYPADVLSSRGFGDQKLHFIQKPFTINALTTKIRDILDTPPNPTKN